MSGQSPIELSVPAIHTTTASAFADGVCAGRRVLDTGTQQHPDPVAGTDTVQEFRSNECVHRQTDRPRNAIFLTRAGTQQLHGSAFETGPQTAVRCRPASGGHLFQSTASGATNFWRITGWPPPPPVVLPTFTRGIARSSFGAGEELRQGRPSTTTSRSGPRYAQVIQWFGSIAQPDYHVGNQGPSAQVQLSNALIS